MDLSKREQNKVNCRRTILRTSRKLFARQGYDQTTVDEIAKKARVSKATIYNYFPNKENLLLGIADEVLEQVQALVDQQLKKKESALAVLKQALSEFVSASVMYLSLSRRIGYLNSCEDSPLYATRKQMIALIESLARKAKEEGTFKKDADLDEITDLVMGLYLISLFEWSYIDRYEPDVLAAKLDRFFDVMLRAYFQEGS